MKGIVWEHRGREQSFAIGQTHMRGRLPAVNHSHVAIAIILLTLALASVNATAQGVPPGCDSPVSGIAQKNPTDHKCGVSGRASFRGLLKDTVKNNFLVPGGPPVGMALSALARVHKAVEQKKIQSGSEATLSTDRNVLKKTGVEL